MTQEQGLTTKNALLTIVLLTLLAGAAYLLLGKTAHYKNTSRVACTMEAKMCPDGSYVGRSGPICEFAQCPDVVIPSGWKTSTNTNAGISFAYPETLGTKYISTQNWPPQITIGNAPFSCTPAGSVNAVAGKTEKKIVDGHTYCVTTETEGAAGSTYSQYAYLTDKAGKTLILTFTIRATQCANYDDPQKTECEKERQAFSPDALANQIMQTVVMK